ncbi:4'-phosphopantetheinyl transferase [Streptomyces sp. NPDC015127]|uniref:4'-phosphopantetheinyl transferase family protein n=1 Tax=Streptomyces sp. NPDC015127 TaxID=3364939 RepID=UPI0036F4D38B
MIERILPPGVAVSEAFDDPPDTALFPEEALLVRNAVDQRRREFATVRMCARRALAALGVPPVPVLPGRHGAPRWPDAVVGSLTHCAGYRAAALAEAAHIAMLGIDAEPHGPLPDGVLDAIALPRERSHLRDLRAAEPRVCWDRLLFSMKESVYKAWNPFTGRRLGFEDAEMRLDPAAGTFTARLLVRHPLPDGGHLDRLDGRWLVRDGLALTAIAVHASRLATTPERFPVPAE